MKSKRHPTEYRSKPCVQCGHMTVYACADCAINSGGKESVHVCSRTECQREHEKIHAPILRCPGISRFSDNELCIGFHFSRRITDAEMRVLHDVMIAACEGLNEGQGIIEAGGNIEANEKLFAATKGSKPN